MKRNASPWFFHLKLKEGEEEVGEEETVGREK